MVILEIPYNKRWNIIVTFENVSQFSTQRSNGNKHDKILFLDSRQYYHIIKSTTQHRNRHCLYISWAINTTTFQRSSAKIKNQFYLSIYRKKPISKLIPLPRERMYISIQLDRTLDTFHCIKFPSLVSRVTISVFLLRGRGWRNVCQGGPRGTQRNDIMWCRHFHSRIIIMKPVVTRISRSRMREFHEDEGEEGAERFHEADVYYYRLVDNTFPRERSHPTEKVCKIAEY